MKNVSYILIVLVGCFACTNTDVIEAKKEDSLFKTWQLTESLADIGDGKATWQKVESGSKSTLTFAADGTFKQVNGNETQTGTYRLVDEKSTSVLFIKPNDAQGKEFKWTIIDLSESNLNLTFGCIEACGAKYVPVK